MLTSLIYILQRVIVKLIRRTPPRSLALVAARVAAPSLTLSFNLLSVHFSIDMWTDLTLSKLLLQPAAWLARPAVAAG